MRKLTKLFGIILPALVAGFLAQVNLPISSIEVEAAGPRPTNVNVTNLDDAQVNAYYPGVAGLSGDSLLGALYPIIDGHIEYDYKNDSDRLVYKIIDRNWAIDPLTAAQLANFDYTNDNGYIHKLYADYNDDVLTADHFKNVGATRVSFDKEHIWAQSLGNFGRTTGAGSDFHALWPADVVGNTSAHSNYNFAIPTTGITTYNNDKGTYVGRNGTITGFTEKVFEPIDQYKGDIARAMFYMPARYYEYIDAVHPKLELVNGSPSAVIASASVTGKAGDLATLLAWNELDPVDDYEIKRNNLIYNNYQGNRNPFIDHPEWARIAYDATYSGPGASTAAGSSSVGTPSVTLSSVAIATPATKTSFGVGETFSSAGLTLTATYSDATTATISSGFTTNYDGVTFSSSASNLLVTVTYQGKTTTYTINVTEVPAAPSDLFFSEYVEGSSYNKYLEIYNPKSTSVDLSNYNIRNYTNGSATVSNILNLSGILAPYRTYTIGEATGTIFTPNLSTPSSVLGFNGDDTLVLFNKITNTEVDIFGQIGFDPGTAWGTSPAKTVDATLVRKPHILSGDTNGSDVFDPALEWIGYPIDTVSYLGDAVNGATGLKNYLMAADTANQCQTKFADAKVFYNALSPAAKTYFNSDTTMNAAKLRLNAWATYLGQSLEPTAPKRTILSSSSSEDSLLAIIIISVIGLTALFGNYLINRKKNK